MLSAGISLARISCQKPVASDDRVTAQVSVIDVEEPTGGEVGRKGDAKKPLLAPFGTHAVGDIKEGRGLHHAILHQIDAPLLFNNE